MSLAVVRKRNARIEIMRQYGAKNLGGLTALSVRAQDKVAGALSTCHHREVMVILGQVG